MNTHDRTVDHLHFAAVRLGHSIHQPVPDAGLAPAIEAIVGGRIRPVALRQIAPWCSGSQNPENAVEDAPVVSSSGPRTSLRQNRFDDAPLVIREIVAHDASSAAGQLESLFADLRYN